VSLVPQTRVSACNEAPVRGDGDYVLYWMIAARRARWNFALDRAVDWAVELCKPIVILEALRWEFPWQSKRIRRFVADGMAANARSLQGTKAFYYPYLATGEHEGKGLLGALASRACVIVTDEFPCFFLPGIVSAAGARMPVLLEQVDSNGLLPMRAAPKEFSTAFAFRRFLQKQLPEHLLNTPRADPFERLANAKAPRLRELPESVISRWPKADLKFARKIDSSAGPELRGGSEAAKERLIRFLLDKLRSYPERRNEPGDDATSGLSPYLHFGHISGHEIFASVAKTEGWTRERVAVRSDGSRAGWWGMSAGAEAFLDQVITWRELGFNCCHMRKDYDQYESLPAWAQNTLKDHEKDTRTARYGLEQLEGARTHDRLWNAAQTQLVTEGRIHNYLRMLWGKKIIEWTRSPREALRVMIELNNRYALDGRDPNSYSGIFWCLGRYDRPWGPERPIFGTVRYMSSENAARKLHLKTYLRKYSPEQLRLSPGMAGSPQ
jgi:deoxyribodipyrimidine photo-lyase